MSVPSAVQHAIRARAKERYEYCHSPEWVCAARFTLDHLLPQSLGGTDEPQNLALACRRCNERHYNFTTGRDPATHQDMPLFHPVRDVWAEHFAWTPEGQWIVGTTPIGRAQWNGWISMTSVTTMASSGRPVSCGCEEVGIHPYLIRSYRKP